MGAARCRMRCPNPQSPKGKPGLSRKGASPAAVPGGLRVSDSLLPSPLAGEGGETEQSEVEPGEGCIRVDAGRFTPHPPRDLTIARHPLPQGATVFMDLILC
ncbi:hypothetical protein BLTE_23700 [Blastochloris tepida]|uniref:Uncharacterized protein n=1 Tax=Blastochloris tepida TaxID=2233851 RepID=A0A348G2A2_9HYPH|nr:hypothetical protein BLTE_23700 [Blastochloris tepida]